MHVNLKSNLFDITSIVWAFISLPYSSQHSATQVRTHISVFTERTNRRIKALVICFHSHANQAVGSYLGGAAGGAENHSDCSENSVG